MIKKLVAWMFAQGINAIGVQLNQAYKNKLNAKNNTQRIDAELEITKLNAQLNVLIAEQKYRVTRWIRPALAMPFVIYDFKIIVWDKVLGWGVTDSLPQEFWQLQMIVFGAYFLTRPIEKMKISKN